MAPAKAFLRAVRQIGRGLLGIIERNQPQTLQPLGRIAAELGEPIVVDLETGALKARVFDPEHAKTERGVQHIAGDAVLIHVFDALRRIPAAAVRAGIGEAFQQLLQFFQRLVGAEAQDHIVRLAIRFDEPPGAGTALILGLHMRRDPTVFFRQALLPQI